MATPSLPQHDPEPDERRAELVERREDYRYTHELLGGVALAEDLPRCERPTLSWWCEVAEIFAEILGNANTVRLIEVTDGERDDPELIAAGHERFAGRLRQLARGEDALKSILRYTLQAVVASSMRGTPRSLAEYDQLYAKIPRPDIALNWTDDRVFARMRLAGPTPYLLHCVRDDRLPDHFPVDQATFARSGAAAHGDSLAAALAEGRLFMTDYLALEGLAPGRFPDCLKYVSAPLALFVAPCGRTPLERALRPVAIQCQQRPSAQNPIFTPSDGFAWLQAKLAVQTAEGNIHQAVTHLAHTHLVMEAVAMAARRQLAPHHPVHLLLAPHIEGTLYINEQAQLELMAEGGGVDYVLNSTIAGSRDIAAAAVRDWQLSACLLPNNLELRGVADAERLPDYPFRDDGLLIWAAIHEWVESYLRVYYRSDAELLADPELQAFAAEIVSEQGGRLHGWAREGGGRFRCFADLVEFMSHVLFTASAGHAAVNYPQLDLMSYAPAYPLAQYAPTPSSASEANEASLLRQLPNLQAAHVQMSLGVLLGSLHYTKLGDYRGLLDRHFDDARVHGHERRFVDALELAQATIERRNSERWMPYPYLLPERIPQSINV